MFPSDPCAAAARIIHVTMTATLHPRSLTPVVSRDPDDAVLLARIQAGDELALETVYDRHASLVYGLARRVTRDEYLARDITQEVFTYLWELPDRVDLLRGSIRAYLAVVTHRRAVDEVRRSERRARAEAGGAVHDSTDGPEIGVVDSETQVWRTRRLAAGLARLPAEQRVAIELAYYDGLTYQEVARALDIPEGTAKSRLRLAMNRLRTLLGDEVRTAMS